MSIKIDFKNKQLEHTCSDNENACGKSQTISFEEFKNKNYSIACTPCTEDIHDMRYCTHCPVSESYNLTCFVQNLELHDNPRDMQINPDVWENNRQYHILRRMLEHGKEYDEVKDEPDLYEQVHQIVGRKAFHKVWVEHEQGIKDMREYKYDET